MEEVIYVDSKFDIPIIDFWYFSHDDKTTYYNNINQEKERIQP